MEGVEKGRVCVTGGTGFLASWLIKKLLERGYSVNTTIRSSSGGERDISYLTDLLGASGRLQIFEADLDKPEDFEVVIKGCVGLFHVAHPMDLADKEPEQAIIRRSINGTLGILQSCLVSKTVKRVVYTSSASTVGYSELDEADESNWTDVEFIRRSLSFGASYAISKTLTEKAALEFSEKHGLDLVSVIPTWIHGPFVTPHCPGSVQESLALLADERVIKRRRVPFVHTDDVADAHIFLFEYPLAKGRYICSAVEITVDELSRLLSGRYNELQKPFFKSNMGTQDVNFPRRSSKKLLDTGFKYKYGVVEMYDDAIECCKQKGIL